MCVCIAVCLTCMSLMSTKLLSRPFLRVHTLTHTLFLSHTLGPYRNKHTHNLSHTHWDRTETKHTHYLSLSHFGTVQKHTHTHTHTYSLSLSLTHRERTKTHTLTIFVSLCV